MPKSGEFFQVPSKQFRRARRKSTSGRLYLQRIDSRSEVLGSLPRISVYVIRIANRANSIYLHPLGSLRSMCNGPRSFDNASAARYANSAATESRRRQVMSPGGPLGKKWLRRQSAAIADR